jgi:hypothetical protein
MADADAQPARNGRILPKGEAERREQDKRAIGRDSSRQGGCASRADENREVPAKSGAGTVLPKTESASDANAPPNDAANLSEYERMRDANIRRNQALLESLDIPTAALPFAQAGDRQQASEKKTLKKRKSLLAGLTEDMIEPRRSGRRLALAEAASAKVGRRLEFKQKPRTENRKLSLEPKA